MENKRYRVVQWATGNIGTRALRAVIEHPELELAREIPGHRLDLLLPPPQIARSPIHIPQTVQNRALDPMLGVGMEHDILGVVVLEPQRG